MGKKKSKKGGGKSKPKKRLQQQPRKPIPEALTSGPVQNPFEMRVNKRKHDNLGRRGRNELGVPGISRGKAIEKRNKTLLQEYKVRNKSSVLLDNRIGEKRKGMPEEEKIIRRSAAEKARQFKKKSIFNLQDTDEFLTHRGQPLMDIDRYEDPRDASDSEDERLNADFVSDANFGGFMRLKKSEEEEPAEEDMDEDGQPKSHKQIIQELIQASKQKKYEKAKEADENYELVCQLDEQFKDPEVQKLLFGVGKVKRDDPPAPVGKDREEYDVLVKQLQFETKTGNASNRLKTEEEVAEEEKLKLEMLEKDRLRRMQMTDSDGTLKHRSADDLDDGFYLGEDKEPKESEEAKDSDDEEEEADEEGSEDDDEEEVGSDDSFSDLAESEEEPDSETEQDGDEPAKVDGVPEKTGLTPDLSNIPFVLEVPVKYKEFENMLKKYGARWRQSDPKGSATLLNEVLSRIIKYNTAADRSKLPQLFNYIVRYALECTETHNRLTEPVLSVCEVVIPHLHGLLVLIPTACMEAVEKGEIFDDFYPLNNLPLFKLLYFDLCSALFCCTDFNHHVLSPVKARLLGILGQHKVTNTVSLLKVLYVIKILYRLSAESRRYCPEIINSIGSILQCYTGTSSRSTGLIIPCLQLAKGLLFIGEDENGDCGVETNIWILLNERHASAEINTRRKLGILYITLDLAKKFIVMYERLPSSREIFARMRKTLTDLKTRKNYPEKIIKKIEENINAIDNLKQAKEALAIAVSDKPKPLRLYEPLVEEDFDGMRKKKAPKGKQETARLAHKVKQEMKSAVREIRKDTAFLANQQLREQIQKDSERKRKVKEIMGSLATQEGEYQKSKRGKK